MKVSHKEMIMENPAIAKLCEYLEERAACWQKGDAAPDFEKFEKEVHQCTMAIEREIVIQELKNYDVCADEIVFEDKLYKWAMTSPETYHCAAGKIRIERQLYRPVGRETKSICPLEMRSGIIMGLMTPSAARQSTYILAHLPAKQAEKLFNEIGNLTPSRSTLGKLPSTLSQQWESNRADWESKLRHAEVVPPEAKILVISQDGVMAPMKDGNRTATRTQPDKQASGPAGYREVGCGTVSLYDNDGVRLQTIRYGRMPEKNKRTLHNQLEAECQNILPLRPDLTVVKLADGAKDNWQSLGNLDFGLGAATHTIRQVEIVDFFHGAEHLKTGCDAIWGKATAKTKAEFERLRTFLKEADNGVDKVINVLRYHLGRVTSRQRRKIIAAQLTYFRNQRHRMRYASYLQQGLPIASGVVEAACKTLVTQRMKCSGMAWKQIGGQAILTMRSLIQSDRWNAAWQLLKRSFCRPVAIPA